MLIRPASVGAFLLLMIFAIGSAHGQVGCCSCTGFGGMPDASGCSSVEGFCTAPVVEGGCVSSGGTFMPFTTGLVCAGDEENGRCVAAGAAMPAPALSLTMLLVVAAMLALVGYRATLWRRASR